MPIKILFADSNHEILHHMLQTAGFECDLFWNKSADELKALLPQYDALVIRSKFKLDAELLAPLTKLKAIGRVGAGMENIDVAFAEAKGIRCLCVPEGNSDAVGEHALGMLLMLLNHLKKADREVRQGIWLRAENRGTELSGKTVGIIGFGHMGTAFARKLSGFGCTILAHDKYKQNYGTTQVQAADLERIYAEADVVSLHLPLTDETSFYANAAFFNAFKKPIYLLNTARGKCLDTAALLQAMKQGKVLGACLDVLEYESLSFETLAEEKMPPVLKEILASERVILSPHIAGWTHESNYKMSKGIAEKIIRVLSPIR